MIRKQLLFILIILLLSPCIIEARNPYPKKIGLVEVRNKNPEEIYLFIKEYIDELNLSKLEITNDYEDHNALKITGTKEFDAKKRGCKGKIDISMQIDCKDRRFLYEITIIDIYVENSKGEHLEEYKHMSKYSKEKSLKNANKSKDEKIEELLDDIENLAVISLKLDEKKQVK